MFAFDSAGVTYLPTLFYNTKRKQFVLVTFVTDGERKVLHTLVESTINIDCIRLDRLAYNAHMDDDAVHVSSYISTFSRPTNTMRKTISNYFT